MMFVHLVSRFFQIVLPTFILEKRSLLEMFADYMAHPDLYIQYVLLSVTLSGGFFNSYCLSSSLTARTDQNMTTDAQH